MKKIIILTEPRSGSELLYWTLSMSINNCEFPTDDYHEILNFYVNLNSSKLLKKYFKDNQLEISIENAIKNTIEIQKEYFESYDICKIYKNYNIPKNNEYWLWLKTQDYNLIHLIRENTLRRFVSLEIGQKTNIWHTRTSIEHPTRIEVNTQNLLSFIRDAEDATKFVNELYDVTTIKYEDMICNVENYISEIIKTLKEESDKIILLSTLPTNPFKLNDIIINYDEVKSEIKNINQEWMLEE